jgi:hypothetical protein
MKLFTVALLVMLTGCASSTSQYYEAVQKAAQANAEASKAKFDALSKIASAGDGQAASAAVMALALTQTPTITPQPQQSQALQWASILATPVTSLGMMWMQSDSAKTMAKYNARVDMARVGAESNDNQALYQAFIAAGATDYTPFVDGMVSISNTGMNSVVTLEQSDNDLVEALMQQYNATINNFIDNPLVNTTTTTNTVSCSTSDDGTTTTVTCN